MTHNVLMPVANGSEDMEVAIIADLLRRAQMNLTLASVEQSNLLTFANGLKVEADALLTDVATKEFDLIVLPGGIPGAEHLRDSELLIELLAKQKQRGGWIAAICASPAVVLNHHGLISEAYATCYPSFQEQLNPEYLMPEDAVVIDEHHKVITSQGPGTAMRFAIAIIEELAGLDAADAVEDPLCMIMEAEAEECSEGDECCGGKEGCCNH